MRGRCSRSASIVVGLVGLVGLVVLGPLGPFAPAGPAAADTSAAETTVWPGDQWPAREPSYGMTVETGIPVKLSDGVTTYVDVGYPTDRATGQKATGEFPVLLTQNPYSPAPKPDEYFVSRGYIFAVADVRGTGRTEEADEPIYFNLFSPREAQDGVELVRWAAKKLSGSNGVVGLTGCSFLGINQIFTAAAIGPRSPIAAIFPACAYNGYDVYFDGGIPSAIAGLFGGVSTIVGTKHLEESQKHGKELSDDILSGGPRAYNRSYWRARSTARVAPQVAKNGIPAMLSSGWQATEMVGVLDQYSIFQNTWAGRAPYGPMATGQKVTGRYQVVVASGGHGTGIDPSLELAWFDRWVKKMRNGIDKTKTPMHLIEQQTNRWVNTSTNPIVRASTRFFLGGEGALLPAKPSAAQDELTWGEPSTEGTSVDYTSAPFTKAKTIAGPIAVSIAASSSNSNMELIATLEDVAPDGTATTISHGSLIGSMRSLDAKTTWRDARGVVVKPVHPFTRDVYLKPGKAQRFDISLLPTTWAVQSGHSLRLVVQTQVDRAKCAISIEALPQAWPCILTEPQQQTLPGGSYRVQLGGANASSIALPLVNPSALATADLAAAGK